MNGLLRHYFIQLRNGQHLSVEDVAVRSNIKTDVILRFEKGKKDVDPKKVAKLYETLGLNLSQLLSDFKDNSHRFNNIYKKYVLFDISYLEDFKLVEQFMEKNTELPEYYNYLVLKLFLSYEDDALIASLNSQLKPVIDCLSESYKCIYLIALGRNHLYNQESDEALTYFFRILKYPHKKFITSLAEEYICVCYLKKINIGKASEYYELARKHLAEEDNHRRLLKCMIYQAIIFESTCNFDEAKKVYHECLDLLKFHHLQELDMLVLNGLIMSCMLSGDYQQMIVHCETLLLRGDRSNRIYFFKAWAYYKMNEVKAAQIVIEKSRWIVVEENDPFNYKLIQMTDALMKDDSTTEKVVLETMESAHQLRELSFVLFILDQLTEYYYSHQRFEECSNYFFIKKRMLERNETENLISA